MLDRWFQTKTEAQIQAEPQIPAPNTDPNQNLTEEAPAPKRRRWKWDQIKVNPNSELRIKLKYHEEVRVKLISGSALLLGMELTKLFYYKLPKTKSTYLYTLTGCVIEIVRPDSATDVEFYSYEDEDRKNLQLFNLHQVLESCRLRSLKQSNFGPRVLVLGSSNSGKSTVARTLCNLAVAQDWRPSLLDLDPVGAKQNFPGVLSCARLDQYTHQLRSNCEKIAYYFGASELKNRHDLFLALVESLIGVVDSALLQNLKRFKENLESGKFLEELANRETFASGIIIDAPTAVESFSDSDLRLFFGLLSPDFVIVIQNEYLKNKLEQLFRQTHNIVSLVISGGISPVDQSEKSHQNTLQVQNFFYSDQMVFLRDSIPFAHLGLYKLDSIASLPLSYLAKKDDEKLKLTKLDPRITELKGMILIFLFYC